MPFLVIFVASQVKDKSCGAIRRASILILAALGQILDNIESSATTGWEAVVCKSGGCEPAALSQQRAVACLDGQSVLRICLIDGLQLAATASCGKASEHPQVYKSMYAFWLEHLHSHLSAGRPSQLKHRPDTF